MAQQKQVAKKTVEVGPNSSRSNGKAWKRRICGLHHGPDNCSKCTKICSDRWDAKVGKAHAKRLATKKSEASVTQ